MVLDVRPSQTSYSRPLVWGRSSQGTAMTISDSHWQPTHESPCEVTSNSATYQHQQNQRTWTSPVSPQHSRRMDNLESSGSRPTTPIQYFHDGVFVTKVNSSLLHCKNIPSRISLFLHTLNDSQQPKSCQCTISRIIIN